VRARHKAPKRPVRMCVHTPRIRYASRARQVYIILYIIYIGEAGEVDSLFARSRARPAGSGPRVVYFVLIADPESTILAGGYRVAFCFLETRRWRKRADPFRAGADFRRGAPPSSAPSSPIPGPEGAGAGLDSDSHCLTWVLTPDESRRSPPCLKRLSRAEILSRI